MITTGFHGYYDFVGADATLQRTICAEEYG
jgi:hypothetical protein